MEKIKVSKEVYEERELQIENVILGSSWATDKLAKAICDYIFEVEKEPWEQAYDEYLKMTEKSSTCFSISEQLIKTVSLMHAKIMELEGKK